MNKKSKTCFYKWRKENKKVELFNNIELFENHAEIIINSPKYGEKRVLIDLDDVEKCKNKVVLVATAKEFVVVDRDKFKQLDIAKNNRFLV